MPSPFPGMSKEEGDGLPGVTDAAVEQWTQVHSQSSREGSFHGSGAKQHENPTARANFGQDGSNRLVREPTTPNGNGKRTLRQYLHTSPTAEGLKKAKRVIGRGDGEDESFVTVQGLKQAFRNVRDREGTAMYCLSAAFIPLTQLETKGEAACYKCSKRHVIGGGGFRPYYIYGQPFFQLHCTDPNCGHVNDADVMADALMDLLHRLPAHELAYLGFETEPVSDTESEPTLRIKNPLAWMGEESAVDSQDGAVRRVGLDTRETSAVAGPTEPVNRRLDGRALPRDDMEEVLQDLKKQQALMAKQIAQMNERDIEREKEAQKDGAELRKQLALTAELRDQVEHLKKERAKLREELIKSRGERLGREEAQRHALEFQRANDVAAARERCPQLHVTQAPPERAQGNNETSPVLSDAEDVGMPDITPTYSQMAQRGVTVRKELPEELRRRLERAKKALGPFSRRAEWDREEDKRPSCLLYLQGLQRSRKKPPRIIRNELQRLAAPEDRNAVHFVDFIGKNVCEVLLVRDYRAELIASAEYLGYRVIEGSPLAGFATRYQSSSEAN